MAAVTLLGTQTFDTNSGTHTVTATPAVDDLIIIIAANSGNVLTTAPTDNQGGLYVQINTCVKASSADTMKAWVRTTKIASATSTVFTHAIGTSTGGGIAVMKATGVARTGLSAIRQSAVQTNQAAAGTPTPVFAGAALTGNAVIGAVFNATSPATMTPRASPAYTERFDVGYATPTTGLEVMSIDSGETGTSIAWGGTSASAFCSLVLEIDNSAATPIDDGEGWWSGVQRSFVGVAIAGAAAALSLSTAIQRDFIQNEEITQIPPPGPSAGAPPTQRLHHATVFQRWYAQDELPAQASFTPTEEDGPPLALPVGAITSITWATDEEIVPQPVFRPTEEDWPQPIVQKVSPFTQTWVDGDYASFALAEDDWWQPSAQLGKVFMQSWGDDDLPIAPATTALVEEDWQVAIPAMPAAKMPAPWQPDDEIERIGVDEDYWATPRVQTPPPVSQVWTESDFAPFATVALIEDDWSAPAVRSMSAVFSLAWVDDELPAIAPIALDDDGWQAANARASAARLPLPWQFDDQVVSIAPTLEEEQWLQLYSIRPDPVVRLWFDQDEVTQPPTPLSADEDYWLTSPTPPKPFLMTFPVDEDAPTLHDDCCTSAAEIWAYVLPNGMTAADTLVELLELVRELHQIHGLQGGSPLVVTPTQRTAAAIMQSVSDIAGTVTVTRL